MRTESNAYGTLSQPPGKSNGARIVEMAAERLRAKDYRFSRCVTCEYREGVLILRGSVPTYYLKQLAQTAVDGTPGVLQIDNRIDVFPCR